MGKLIPALAIIVIIGAFWYLADSQGNLNETLDEDFKEIKEVFNSFHKDNEFVSIF